MHAHDGCAMQPVSPIAQPHRVLRKPQVTKITGLSAATLWRQVKTGRFPRPIRLSAQAVGWIESEVFAWLDARVAERDRGLVEDSQPVDVATSPAAR